MAIDSYVDYSNSTSKSVPPRGVTRGVIHPFGLHPAVIAPGAARAKFSRCPGGGCSFCNWSIRLDSIRGEVVRDIGGGGRSRTCVAPSAARSDSELASRAGDSGSCMIILHAVIK